MNTESQALADEIKRLATKYRYAYTDGDASHAMRNLQDAIDRLAAMAQPAVPQGWQPIETAPEDGYMLVHEDGAIRALLRIKGAWHKPGYPALVANNHWADVLVGRDAKRILEPLGYRLELRDGCCENPTHWMPLPAAPTPSQGAEPSTSTRGEG